jgi:hypothetical protein
LDGRVAFEIGSVLLLSTHLCVKERVLLKMRLEREGESAETVALVN